MKEFVEKVKNEFKNLPDRKKYAEAISALLTLPVLITVLLLNVNNLKKTNTSATALPTAAPTVEVIKEIVNYPTASLQPTPSLMLTSTPAPDTTPQKCTPQIGPVQITSPDDGELVTSNPLTIEIGRTSDAYCAIVWSYRLDNGNWSDYSNTTISVFNLAAGKKKLDVKVKSVVTSSEIILTRNFVYQSDQPTTAPSPTLTPSPSPTAVATPTLTPTP